MSNKKFWDSRAKKGTNYKGENFYTITPLPFYVKRRDLLLKEVMPHIQNAVDVFDFGCGDGWYVNYFNKFRLKNKIKPVGGLDISHDMVKRAKLINSESNIYHSISGIKEEKYYDLIYSFAVLSHIKNEHLKLVFSNIYSSLKNDGKFIIFEQVAPFQYGGAEYTRRTIEDYGDFAKQNGFKIEKSILLSFDCHRFFERYIAKYYYKLIWGQDMVDRRITANSHLLFRLLSNFFLFLDKNPIKRSVNTGWGNVILILKKQ